MPMPHGEKAAPWPNHVSKRWGGFDIVVLAFSGLAVIAGALAFLRASQTYNIVASLQKAGSVTNTATAPAPVAAAPANVAIKLDSTDPSVGNPDAKVTVVEFSDFQCPFCKRFEETTKQIRSSYSPDQVRFVYLHFPLSEIHPNAEPAAIAAQCVMDLAGDKAFFDYHDQLFARQDELGDKLYYELANKTPGLDQDAFAKCYKNKNSLPEVKADYQKGLSAQVDGTPASFVNGQRVNGGAVPFETIKALIDAELKK